MDSLRKLEEIFAHFPGIGPRQAKRFVHHIQTRSQSSIKELLDLINEVRRSTTECKQCHRFYLKNDNPGIQRSGDSLKSDESINNISPKNICNICSDPNRDHKLLMIVSRDTDMDNIEKSGAYRGLYFVLGGTVPILDKDPEKRIRIKSLLEYIKSSEFSEIILSMNTTPDGENTALLVRDYLKKVVKKDTKITLLGRGLSTGAEIEYADGETLRNALGNRR